MADHFQLVKTKLPQPRQVFHSGPVLSLALSSITQATCFRQIFFFPSFVNTRLGSDTLLGCEIVVFSPGSVCSSLDPPTVNQAGAALAGALPLDGA